MRFVARMAREGALLIDSSTVDPSVSQAIASQARERRLRFIDSPVSGGIVTHSVMLLLGY